LQTVSYRDGPIYGFFEANTVKRPFMSQYSRYRYFQTF